MRTELVIRFGYGAVVPWVNRLDDGILRAIAGPDMLTLRTAAPLRGEDLKTVGHFDVVAGQSLSFVLSYAPSHLQPRGPADPPPALAETETLWRPDRKADGRGQRVVVRVDRGGIRTSMKKK